MTVIPFPSNKGMSRALAESAEEQPIPGGTADAGQLTRQDLEAISGACCDLVRRGLAKGVVRINSGDGDKIVCVRDEGHGPAAECSFVGIGRGLDGRYYLVDSDAESLVHGESVHEVLRALP